MINYNSALKVVNLGDPEIQPDPAQAEEPARAGGARPVEPDGPDPRRRPAVGEDRASGLPRDPRLDPRSVGRGRRPGGATIRLSADSYAPGYEPALAGDGDLSTIWHTEFVGATPGLSPRLVVDLGLRATGRGPLYVPRQDSSNGRVKDFEVRVSADGKTWSEPVARGRWDNDPTFKICRPSRRRRVCPASRPDRGRRTAVHERRRGRRRVQAMPAGEAR